MLFRSPARSRAGNTGGSEASDGGSRDNARHMDDDRISSSLQANVGSTRVAWALRRSAGRGGHPVAEHRHRRCRSRIHVPRNPVTGLGSTDQFPMELGQYNRGGQDTRVAASTQAPDGHLQRTSAGHRPFSPLDQPRLAGAAAVAEASDRGQPVLGQVQKWGAAPCAELKSAAACSSGAAPDPVAASRGAAASIAAHELVLTAAGTQDPLHVWVTRRAPARVAPGTDMSHAVTA